MKSIKILINKIIKVLKNFLKNDNNSFYINDFENNNISNTIQLIIDEIINFIYPNKCGFCDGICKDDLCIKCNIKIKKYEIKNIVIKNQDEKYFDQLISVFKYKNIVRNKIIEYKFSDKPYLYKTFLKTILKNKKICGFLKKYDIIIPIPINKKRKQERKYNQTEIIAKQISKNFSNLNYENNLLIKVKDIIPQSKLTKNQRITNIKNAFEINKNKMSLTIKNKNIILFDDIYTTGSTVNECSKLLKKAGAKKIGVLTIAKD